jgi:sec-independent protein translocase protein TatA
MGIESPVHLLFIAVVALIVLGPKRLPGLARALGDGIREFRGALERGQEGDDHADPPAAADDPPAAADDPPAAADEPPAPASTAEPTAPAAAEAPVASPPVSSPAAAPAPEPAPQPAAEPRTPSGPDDRARATPADSLPAEAPAPSDAR